MALKERKRSWSWFIQLYLIKGYYSSRQDYENVKNKEVINVVSAMICEIGFTSIISVEFLAAQDDLLCFWGINFRNSTWICFYSGRRQSVHYMSGVAAQR